MIHHPEKLGLRSSHAAFWIVTLILTIMIISSDVAVRLFEVLQIDGYFNIPCWPRSSFGLVFCCDPFWVFMLGDR